MSDISIRLPDGSEKSLPKDSSVFQVAESIGPGLAKAAIAGKVNGLAVDLSHRLSEDCAIEIITPKSPEALEIFRHTTSHLLAHAVTELYPGVKIGIGPATQDGFYYDFEKGSPFTPDDLEKIETRMKELVKADHAIERQEIPKAEAIDYFKSIGDDLKVELVEDKCEDATASCYKQAGFKDFCRGPHLPSTGRIGAFKLMSVAGAYWKGDQANQQMSRIYGTAFASKKELKAHLGRLEEAKKRDHIAIGKRLDLFSIQPDAGAGLLFWHPRGAFIREQLEALAREEHRKRGYDLVVTPHIAREHLWEKSGHSEFFKENMYYFSLDDEDESKENYVIKPMNCPFHILIYNSKLKSYRDLPVRISEMGTVYRKEKSGTLHGMLRVRGFTQDDAHIFCTPDQVHDEILGVLDLTEFLLSTCGFSDYEVELSVWDPNDSSHYAGTKEGWDFAESALVKALENKGWPYKRIEGEAAFYGPKIDVKLVDAIGRRWQCSTIQFDFNLPKRFDVTFVNSESKAEHVYMIHRALFGALERFTGILIEHFAGDFPIWLSLEAVRVLAVSDGVFDYANDVVKKLEAAGVRAKADNRNEKIGAKIREAEMDHIPVMLVVGAKEKEAGTVNVRTRLHGQVGEKALSEVAEVLSKAERERALSFEF